MLNLFRWRRSQPAPKKPVKARLNVEALETRDVPATITVNTLVDATANDANISLREAIDSVNLGTDLPGVVSTGAYGTNDTINFAAALNGNPIVLGSALPDIAKSVMINGNGANLTIINANNFGGLTINAMAAGVTVTLSKLAIMGKSTPDGTGTGVTTNATNNPVLNLDSVEITNFQQRGVNHQGTGTFGMDDSTITGNTNGGVRVSGATTGTIRFSTISSNTGSAGVDGANGAALVIQNSTIVNNQIGIQTTGNLTLSSTIVAGNTGSDVALTPVFVGTNDKNLIGENKNNNLGAAIVHNDANGNQVGAIGTLINPMLAALALAPVNAGTRTQLPQFNSPAINKGTANGATTDQNNFAFVGLPDVGAAEFQAPPSSGGGGGGGGSTTTTTQPTNTTSTTTTAATTPPALLTTVDIQALNASVLANLQQVFNTPVTATDAAGNRVGAVATEESRSDVNNDGAADITAFITVIARRSDLTVAVQVFRVVFDGASTSGATIGSPVLLGSRTLRSGLPLGTVAGTALNIAFNSIVGTPVALLGNRLGIR